MIQEIISSVGQGIPQLSEYRIIHASGEPRWLQVRIIPSLDESQAVVRLDGILADITERKLMKEALLKSEQRYKSLFDYNSDVVCEVNLQGNILAINSAAQQITGEALSMVGENLSIMNLFGVENITRMSDYFGRTVRGSAQHYVVASSRKDGSVSHWTMKTSQFM